MRKAVVAAIVAAGIVGAIVTLIAAIVVFSVVQEMFQETVQKTSISTFSIVDYNDHIDVAYDENLNPLYTLTVYVKIENLGTRGSQIVWCEVTRQDLTTIKKSQSVFIEAGAQKIISFVFTSSELGGYPTKYKVWVD